jgi:hypothetical protein
MPKETGWHEEILGTLRPAHDYKGRGFQVFYPPGHGQPGSSLVFLVEGNRPKPEPKAKPARLDADRTAKPLTRLISHVPLDGKCRDMTALHENPELEDTTTGERIPLNDK